MTTTLAPSPQFRQWDNNGNPLIQGQLFTYAAGTVTPLATFTDSTGLTQNPNPLILNSRGEASVWLTANVAYKFVLQDSSGNQIWAQDQIVNAQLLTLYGGVDTGVANAYILNFVANFTSYVDGIFIIWVPANANTGASTININSLGVIALVNQDGSALRAGQITPNQVSSILIKGGKALLINNTVASSVLAVAGTQLAPSIAFAGDPTTGFYFPGAGQVGLSISGNVMGSFAFGTLSGTLGGVSGTVNFNSPYKIVGPLAMIDLQQISGTSNATTFTATISTPAVRPALSAQWISLQAMEDNGAGIYSQVGTVSPSGTPGLTTLTFYKNGSATGWTNTGTKGIGDGSGGAASNVIVYSII